MKKVAFHTLGCKLNFTETSTIADGFKREGYSVVHFTESPDTFVINTCSVTENADRKCRKIVKEAKRISPDSKVFIVGCYAQLKPDEIAQIPGVSGVYGAKDKFEILNRISSLEQNPKPSKGEIKGLDFIPSYSSDHRTRLFFKVQDGCNYNCAFCTIPLARGKSRSTNSDELTRLARKAIKENESKELILTGVNIGDFGVINGRREERFIDLVKRFEDLEEIQRIRISSIEPNLLTNDIIKLVSGSRRFLPHFHIPLQSGSDKILSSMRRRYKRDLYRDRIETIKSLIPDAGIGVDVIVGFPGEGTNEFLETYDFLENLPVSYLHVFPYSERDNTPAIEMDGVVPERERARRADNLRSLSEQKKESFAKKYLGSEFEVLFENKVKNGQMFGFTENYIRVKMDYDPEWVNDIKKIKLSDLDNDLVAKGVEIPVPSTIF